MEINKKDCGIYRYFKGFIVNSHQVNLKSCINKKCELFDDRGNIKEYLLSLKNLTVKIKNYINSLIDFPKVLQSNPRFII